jgi:hypothetical protein
MRDLMKIVESFDSTTSWEWDESDYTGLRIAKFEVAGNRYMVMIAGMRAKMVSFELVGRGQGITGTGSAMTVFSTVLDILRDFIRTDKPASFAFEARKNQPSRVSLYLRMCKSLSHELNDYELEIDDDNSKEVYFLFTRSGSTALE